MRKPLSIILTGLFAASVANADVLIWLNKATVTDTGATTVTKTKLPGYLLLDWDDGSFALVKQYDSDHTFQIEEFSDYDLGVLFGAVGKGQTFVAFNGQGYGGFVLKGLNSTQTIGTNNYAAPKAFKWAGASVYRDDNDKPIMRTITGTATFDSADTAAVAGESWDEVLADIRDYYAGIGYSEKL